MHRTPSSPIRVVLLSALFAVCACGQAGDAPANEPSEIDASITSTDASSARRLDTDSLLFFNLPINSVRSGVSGFDPVSGLCVSVIWHLDPSWPVDQELCSPSANLASIGEPYVVIGPPTAVDPLSGQGPIYSSEFCHIWDYGPNVTLQSLDGCITQPENGSPNPDGTVDLVLEIDSPQLSGSFVIRTQ